MNLTEQKMKFYTVNFCCGIGGQDLGFEQSAHEYKGIHGTFETIAGYDVDPIACKNFERITGSRAICADLFDREQYILFHGEEPKNDWRELTPEMVRQQCNGIYPDMVFMSPPCKGFSRLLPSKTAKLPKYQALNDLPERILDLVLNAWVDNLPAIILMENVPGIQDKNRGQATLKSIKAKLSSRGYVFYENLYDCGEWGGLGQHRTRYLLIARLPDKIPSFVFQPPKLPLKTIGDILGPLHMPGDVEKCGRLHRIQNLAWRTWERLALIPAGKDWRVLENFGHNRWAGAWKIVPWDETSHTVTGATVGVGKSTGVSAVADPRINKMGYGNKYRVSPDNEPSPTVIGRPVGSGAVIYADPKVPKFASQQAKVQKWNEPSKTVIGGAGVYQGALNVSDPRLIKRDGRYLGTYKIVPWDVPANTITGQTDVQTGALNVSDPRISDKWSGAGNYGVMDWNAPAKTVTASGDIHAGATAVADPRIPDPDERGVYIIISADGTWHRPITTYEGAMLQGFPRTLKDGSSFDLVGCSDGKAREYIGNAVPVQTGTAIGNALLQTLMPNFLGDYFWGFSDMQIWVQPETFRDNAMYVL